MFYAGKVKTIRPRYPAGAFPLSSDLHTARVWDDLPVLDSLERGGFLTGETTNCPVPDRRGACGYIDRAGGDRDVWGNRGLYRWRFTGAEQRGDLDGIGHVGGRGGG